MSLVGEIPAESASVRRIPGDPGPAHVEDELLRADADGDLPTLLYGVLRTCAGGGTCPGRRRCRAT